MNPARKNTVCHSFIYLLLAVAFPAAAIENISGKDRQAALQMLEQNGIEHEGRYDVTRYLRYGNGGGMISVRQIYQGLLVFDSDAAFHFSAGGKVLRSRDGKPKLMGMPADVSGINVPSALPVTEKDAINTFSNRARTLHIPDMAGRDTGSVIPGPQCAQNPEMIDAELGIYRKTVVWRVRCSDTGYPLMYINAVSSAPLLFDSGIRASRPLLSPRLQ